MDALIAEKVMGWTLDAEIDEIVGRFWRTPDGFVSGDQFEPSTDIAAAWLVVEALTARGLRIVIRTHAAISDGPRVEITGSNRGHEWLVHHDAPTVPLALCGVALQAADVLRASQQGDTP